MPPELPPNWIPACAHALQRRWRTIDPGLLEEVAADLARDPWLNIYNPEDAAARWLWPVQPNGVLGRLPAEDISKGLRMLPEPRAGRPEQMTVEIDSDMAGRVRLTCRLSMSEHHKSRNWFWTACYAEPACAATTNPSLGPTDS